MELALSELKSRLRTLTDLRRVENVLAWDMTVWMPPGGTPTRAAQLATLQEVVHAHEIDDRIDLRRGEIHVFTARRRIVAEIDDLDADRA